MFIRTLLLAFALLLSLPALADRVARHPNGDTVTLGYDECTLEVAKQTLHPYVLGKMRSAKAVAGGQKFDACWLEQGATVFLLYEDGDVGRIPKSDFRERTL